MIKKLVSSLLIITAVIAVFPVGASAEWKNDSTGWWYAEGSGYSNGWKQIDGFWYYFDTNGYMKTGWLQDSDKWYYLVSSGVMKTGWVQEGSNWYYMDNNGAMVTGKISVNDKVYEFSSNGKWIDTTTAKATNASKEATVTNTNVSLKSSSEKLKATANYAWFNENENTYFKVKDEDYTSRVWNIDGDTYIFDKNGVMIKGEYTAEDGVKYLFGQDGKYIKCLNKENTKLYTGFGITTKSGTNNTKVKLLDEYMMNISDVYSSDPQKDGVRINGKMGTYLDKTQPKATVKGKTLNCKTDQTVTLGVIEVQSIDTKAHGIPNLLIKSESTNNDVAFLGIDLGIVDGYMGNIFPSVVARKPGKTTITIDVNGTTTSFDVEVTE